MTFFRFWTSVIRAVVLAPIMGIFLLAPVWAANKTPVIKIGWGDYSFTMFLRVLNGSDQPVTFNQIANVCVLGAPESFTVGPGETWAIMITQNYVDEGLDNCYLAEHYIGYEDAASAGNTFNVQQSLSSNDNECFDVQIFVIFSIGHTVCPNATGSVLQPSVTGPDGNTICPGGVSECSAKGFAFYIAPPQAFTVTAATGDPNNAMTCQLVDLSLPDPSSPCSSANQTVPPGGSAEISLQGACGAYFRLADRTNVSLTCEGTDVEENWQKVAAGATYTLPQ